MLHPVPFKPGFQTRFPVGEYTPYGYLHTPTHTGTNPTGILRSVPALGFGLFTRGLPWYGMDTMKAVNNYLYLLRPAVCVGDVPLYDREDFDRHRIALSSRYHTENILSYDFALHNVEFSLAFYRVDENALALRVHMRNRGEKQAEVKLSAASLYGMNGRRWWGSDAATARYIKEEGAVVSKILAYGDVFALMGETAPGQGVTARTEEELAAWRQGTLPLDGGYKSRRLPDPALGALLWEVSLSPGACRALTVVAGRGVSERLALQKAKEALSRTEECLHARLMADHEFYSDVPLLRGDWPRSWKNSWIYDFGTLRGNLMDPAGIYRSVWDGMQALNPRVVLGETAIDMLTLGYARPDLATQVFEGMFADAPEACVPCTREDGSMNMIGEDGSECPTAPIWGMPIRAIRILLARTGDLQWIRRMYPRLKAYIKWWQENRTDSQGWFHCNNSWESGQDGSSRFVAEANDQDGPREAANAVHVRTADLEAAMASAMGDMAAFAGLLGYEEDKAEYERLYERGLERTRSMFVEKCFRDFDARTGKPFLVEGQYDMMLTMPVALGLAAPWQREKMGWLFELYDGVVQRHAENKVDQKDTFYGPIWPPILQTVVEAAHQMGELDLAARMAAGIIGPAYLRNDARIHWPSAPLSGIPQAYSMMIPGNSRENMAGDVKISGCENYGWGALSPALILENLVGLRHIDPLGRSFKVTPVLPDLLPGACFKVENLSHGPFRFDLTLTREGKGIRLAAAFSAAPGNEVTLSGPEGEISQGMEMQVYLAAGESAVFSG